MCGKGISGQPHLPSLHIHSSAQAALQPHITHAKVLLRPDSTESRDLEIYRSDSTYLWPMEMANSKLSGLCKLLQNNILISIL